MGAIKSTEIFFVHSNQKKKNIFTIIVFVYAIALLFYFVLQAWVFRIVLIPVETMNRTMHHHITKYSFDNERKKTQRLVILSSPYGIRILGSLWTFPFHKKPMRRDIVLIAHRSKGNSWSDMFFYKNFWERVRNIMSLMTFNIIKSSMKYSVMRVVATEYETVAFSGAKVYEQDTLRVILSNDRILPYVNTDNIVRVPHGEVFLTSDIPYGLDSRYQGTYRISEIIGQVKFFIGPLWGRIENK